MTQQCLPRSCFKPFTKKFVVAFDMYILCVPKELTLSPVADAASFVGVLADASVFETENATD